MKKRLSGSIVCGALLVAGQSIAPAAEETSPANRAPMTLEDTVLVTVTASVKNNEQEHTQTNTPTTNKQNHQRKVLT